MSLLRIFTLLLMLLVLSAEVVFGQCSMCVTALEQNGGELAAGFNRGILFLLGMPYLVFSIIGASWYIKRKRRDNTLIIR